MKLRLAVLLAVGCLTLAACQSTATPVPSPASATPTVAYTPTVIPRATPPAQAVTETPPGAQNAITTRVIADLAKRLRVDRDDITVDTVFSDEFSAQDLGCPSAHSGNTPVQPAFVTGTVVQLRVGETLYEYHVQGARFVFCGQR